jgi:Holliday junction DNA helicase RuvA
MIFFLKGIVQELTPTYAVLDVNGVGYYVGISLQTSNKLTLGKETFIFTQQIIKKMRICFLGFIPKKKKKCLIC